jgi:hypothetical protein
VSACGHVGTCVRVRAHVHVGVGLVWGACGRVCCHDVVSLCGQAYISHTQKGSVVCVGVAILLIVTKHLEIRRKNKRKGRETYLKQCLSWDTDILSANVRPTLLNMNAMQEEDRLSGLKPSWKK